jgi:8-amino-7-oxononanoate synthase
MEKEFESFLQALEAASSLRTLQHENRCIDFSSNDYLGLSRSNELLTLTCEKWQHFFLTHARTGLGSTGSRLLTGNFAFYEDVEAEIAHFHGYEASLLFSSGYMANLGLISALVSATKKELLFIYDLHSHASLHDALRIFHAKKVAFFHQDLHHLTLRLKSYSERYICVVCVESIYSIDGQVTDLAKIASLTEQYGAFLIVDEAHAVGVCGREGKGLVAEQKLQEKVLAEVVTFGKALGVSGACVLGSHHLKKVLVNRARSAIYSTSLPQIAVCAISASYACFPKQEALREALHELCINSPFGTSHIQKIEVGEAHLAKQVANQLQEEGFDVRALVFPTVPRKKATLRILLHSYNTIHQIQELKKAVGKLLI